MLKDAELLAKGQLCVLLRHTITVCVNVAAVHTGPDVIFLCGLTMAQERGQNGTKSRKMHIVRQA